MKNALLVIDFINDIVHPAGKTPSCAAHVIAQNALENANQALEYAREQNWLVIFVKVGFEPNYHAQPKGSAIFGKADKFQALKLGGEGTEFHQSLTLAATDYVIEKPRVSPFYGTSLDVVLRTNKIEHIYLSGVSTTWAIQATTRDAHDRDYGVTILENACAANDQIAHQASIAMLSHIAQVITVDELSQS